MAEWAGDILMLVIVGFVLWGLAGDAVKKLGLGGILDGVRPVVRFLWDGVVWVAYKVFVGRDPGVKHLTHDPNRAEPANDRAPRSNAVRIRSPRSVNVQEPAQNAIVDAATLALMQRIAAHKIQRPSDGKEASGLAVANAKKGSSKAYQAFAAAWDLLYPPLRADDLPAGDPNAWDTGDRNGQMVRRERKPRPPLPV